MWTQAHALFRHERYLALAEAAAWPTWDGTSTFPTLCCGLAGRAYGLLSLYRHTGRPEWLERARTLAARAVRAAEHPRAEFAYPLSLYKGRTGVAVLMADLEHPEASSMPFFEPEGWPEPHPV